jgi:2-haloacid dehalogenase
MEKALFVPGRIDAIVFDVIGTLVDDDATWMRIAEQLAVESGLSDPGALRARWVELLDERMNAVIEGEAPWGSHSQLIGDSAQDSITDLGGNATSETAALVASIEREYAAWPDVAAATAALRRSRLVAGVSNGDLDSLARLSNTNAISWDIVLSTGAVQTFKPAPAAYRYAIDTLGIDPARTLFVASHPWDLRAAAGHGFRTAYVARPGADRPSDDDRFDLAVDDLSVLPVRLS